MRRALHMIHSAWQLTDYTDLAEFDLVVCNASMQPYSIRAKTKSSAILAASFNVQMIPSAGPSNPFFISLRSAMDPYYFRSSGVPVRNSTYGDYYFHPWLAAYDAYASWIIDNCHYTHLYLDDCGAFPAHKLRDLGDMVQDVEMFHSEYDVSRAWFLSRLREKFGLIGNTAGWMSPHLDGICIERSHIRRLGKAMSLARFAIQWTQTNIRGRSPVNVDWHREFGDLGWLAMGGEVRG